jgi:hypothetical protein
LTGLPTLPTFFSVPEVQTSGATSVLVVSGDIQGVIQNARSQIDTMIRADPDLIGKVRIQQ